VRQRAELQLEMAGDNGSKETGNAGWRQGDEARQGGSACMQPAIRHPLPTLLLTHAYTQPTCE
jgi:hypothetical protein